jgi:hypothetical protein
MKRREYWGTDKEICERRATGACLKCGDKNHMVRDCEKKTPLRSPICTNRQKLTPKIPKVATALPAKDTSLSEEEGKEQP